MGIKSDTQSISLQQHLSYICSRLLAYGLPLLYFLVSISFYLKTYDSAQVKITFTQIGTSILLFIWVVKILVEGKLPFNKQDLIYVGPLLAFLLSGIISFTNSPFRGWAFEEALRRFFYIILALITIAEIRSEERMARLWRWLLAAAWVAIGYGLIQYIDTRFFPGKPGIDKFIWRQAFAHRVFSTFGNPNFYGNFLVIVTPIILASVLKAKGSLRRPIIGIFVTLAMIICIDKMTRGFFGGHDPSLQIVLSALLAIFFVGFMFVNFWGLGKSNAVSAFLVLFCLLFLNLYSTETKGAWLGFVAAFSVTFWLIFEFFLHPEERQIERKKYLAFLGVLIGCFTLMLVWMSKTFVLPLFGDETHRVGFAILWVPVAFAAFFSVLITLWAFMQPWNLKKIIYAFLVFFVLTLGGGVLQYAKERLVSVSFRIFTWIATWEMIQTRPLLGTGVGSFKAAYPAFRRPHIIVLEGKSNTETDHSEDEYIEVWYDEGIIGFGIFLWLVLTALFCGMSQLRWYSRIRPPPELRKKKKFFQIESDPRSYEVLGILGAYVGALIHWTVDVSVRFVSSGIFSGLLPGLLIAYSRNHKNPIPNEPRMWYEKWIRVGLAGIWTAVFLGLKMELVPATLIKGGDTGTGQIIVFGILAGLIIYAILEVLEIGLEPKNAVKFEEHYPPPAARFLPLRVVAIAGAVVILSKSLYAFGNYFQADVHHNLAIFFSKQGVWKKEPKFGAKLQSFPPDIREKYKKWGGALEHYEQVIKKNPGFPMARYFTGNVYNDRGSQFMSMSMNARAKGNTSEANRLKEKAFDSWQLAEEAYDGTKSLAPNYVQIHHQVGLIYLKRAQAEINTGNIQEGKKYLDEALVNFYKYRMLDPVFPQNYHRIVEILILDHQYEKAEKLYEEAIYYNDVVARDIRPPFNNRISEFAVSLGKLYYTHATRLSKNPFNPRLEQIDKSIEAFELAIETNPKNIDGYKGAARIYSLMGEHRKSQEYLQKAIKINPNDPELKAVVKN